MIITFNGDEGSGKSTIAKKVAQTLDYPHYYMGRIFRDMAKERGLTLEEFHETRDNNPNIDQEVENYIVDLSKNNDNLVIESRTAWHFVPQSLKIYLKVDENEAAKRIFLELQKDISRNEAKDLDSIDKVLESIRNRREKDEKRYLRFYGIDIRDEKNYGLVLDTTNLTIDEVFEKVMEFIKSK